MTQAPIFVTGTHGLIGSALLSALRDGGRPVIPLVRPPAGRASGKDAPSLVWDPAAGILDSAVLEGGAALIHLGGVNIGDKRWTPDRKRRLRDSRVLGTHFLATTLARLARPPRLLICASAQGFYGDRGEEVLTEESGPGGGFLSELVREWEAAADPARAAGIRVVHLRFGVVLAAREGALARMLPPFRLGLGARLGRGRQFLSWIALADALRVILHALADPDLQGPVNTATPYPVTNAEFTATLAAVLSRPAMLVVPEFALRLAFGEMAEETLLSSTRVQPARLLASGFEFRYPHLEAALRHELRRSDTRKRSSK